VRIESRAPWYARDGIGSGQSGESGESDVSGVREPTDLLEKRRMRRLWACTLLVLSAFSVAAAACSSTSDSEAGPPNVTTGPDGSIEEPGAEGGSQLDAATDTNASDSPGGAGDILGTLVSGSCGVVKTQLTQTTPSFENNLLVFVAGEKYEKASLSSGGQTLYDTPNAGGSSGESEVMSFEVLRYCEGASFLKAENDVKYQPPDDSGANSITDILVEIGGKKVGVSVTRVYRPASQPFPDSDVKALLEKKLEGINRSSIRVLPVDKWVKQILHIFSVSKATTDAVARVLPTISSSLRADTIVLVTQTTGGGFVYCNPDPPLGTECQ
jgi:hypothetical protein